MKPTSVITTILFLLFLNSTEAQKSFWTKIEETNLRNQSQSRTIVPERYLTFSFDFDAFKTQISNGNRSGNSNYRMSIPMPDASTVDYDMVETNIFDPALALKYPGYTSFTGTSKQAIGSLLKMSVSPFGIHVMILNEQTGSVFIDPYTPFNETEYIVYYKKDYKSKTNKFSCEIKTDNPEYQELIPNHKSIETASNRGNLAGDCTLRTYRLALACTGEYSSYHGGTVEKVLAAYNASMTRVNGLYERDLAITMKLVANTDKLIYLSSSTDPYTNNNGSAMLNQNQTTIDNIIGLSNYDIGHVFSTGGGGIAQLRAPCSSSKAQGVTGSSTPKNDPFDIDYVAHEMGHQFGANHTQNNNCQRNSGTAVEPGSASTIMGYAGICSPDVQNNSDAHFHGVSIGEITNFIVAGQGNTCAVKTPLNNSKPEVSTTKNSYTIPISTSFFLDATGTDINGDLLTYCWEQTNNETATMPPKATNTGGPSFRSLPPSLNSTRYFPDLQNKYTTWEVLPSVTRTMKFRCTVRDNHLAGGCTAETDMEVKTNVSAGPFVVLNPNIAISWQVGSIQTITWSVAKTDLAPINCSFVTIKLSTDGGITYPNIIASGVPNNGSFQIETPNLPTTKARIMVVSDGNIFYDVSNTNFAITSTFAMSVDGLKFDICDQSEVVSTISLEKLQNPTESITMSVESVPQNLQFDFDINPVLLPGSSKLTLSNLFDVDLGNHVIRVIGASGNEKLISNIELFIGNKVPTATTLVSPGNYEQQVDTNKIIFAWDSIKGVKTYDVEISESPSFDPIVFSGNFENISFSQNLSPNQVYYWRAKGNSPCSENPFGETFSFKTKGNNLGSSIILKNNILIVASGQAGEINQSKIDFVSQNDSVSYITITKLPKHGSLSLSNNQIVIGSKVNLSDIKNNKLVYTHNLGGELNDEFKFDVIDDRNRWLPNNTFLIHAYQSTLASVSTIAQDVLCNGDSNAIIKMDAFGGQAPYMYSIDGTNYQDSNTFPNLASGVYPTFVKDDLGSIYSANTISLNSPSEIKLDLNLDFYDIVINSTGGTGIIAYSTNNIDFNESNSIIDPGNGQYVVYAKDELGCNVSKSLEINVPSLKIETGITTDILCFGNKATIESGGTGGFPPYEYSVDGGTYQTNPIFLVDAGVYQIRIKDKGNKVITSDTLKTETPSSVTFTLTSKKLNVFVNAMGGTGEYTYSIDGVTYTGKDTITFADNGTYRIYVKDSNGCIRSNNISLNVFKDVQKTIRNVNCYKKNDGYIKLLAENGAFPFQYSLNDSPLSSTREWSNLSPGDYSFTIIDGRQDSVVGNILITEPDSLMLNLLIDANNLTIEVTGGTPPYNHSIDGGIAYLGTNKFTDLPENTYNIAVKDQNGCVTRMETKITAVTDVLPSGSLMITPNPSRDFITLTSDELLNVSSTIKLRDVAGKILDMTSQIERNKNRWIINLSGLSSGIYIVELTSINGIIAKKFIKI